VGGGSVRGVSGPADVPAEILDRLRPICLVLPETYEQPAWIGTRWRIRQRTFAHVFSIEPTGGRPPTGAAGADRSVCRLTFRSAAPEITALLAGGHPYYKPDWATDVLGMIIDDGTDWDEVGELLTESYCLLAPKKLTTRVIRPSSIQDQPQQLRPASGSHTVTAARACVPLQSRGPVQDQ
jgi:YjbR protein